MIFPNPPITEAIFDITVNLRDSFNHEILLTFHEEVKESFPNIQKRMAFQGGIELKLDNLDEIHPQLLPISNKPEGYIFVSQDEKRVVQARLNGFTFSRLKPYESWESFYTEANQLWEKYAQLTSPVKVTRLALRYINQILIPATGTVELKNYIKTVPEISNDLSVIMEDYFMRIIVAHADYRPSKAIINQTIGQVTENEKGERVVPLIFDIDVFQQVNLQHDDEEIKNIFELNLRSFRDEIFFKSITNQTKELFK
ncbi:TIGR04255 family protein [Chlorogloeopsis fritschii PCC 9212]|uniref:TIGR04255 family protein n=1 Tax=Chlorogloeopsis fritschii TaxID=1124 RepID=UPI00370D205D